jgi:hypothetical protein
MTSVSRSVLLAAGLLTLVASGALAQQNTAGDNGSSMKSTKPGEPAYQRPTVTSPAGGSAMRNAEVGDAGNKASSGAANPQTANNQSSK